MLIAWLGPATWHAGVIWYKEHRVRTNETWSLVLSPSVLLTLGPLFPLPTVMRLIWNLDFDYYDIC